MQACTLFNTKNSTTKNSTLGDLEMNARRFTIQLSSFIFVFALICGSDMRALAQDGHSHETATLSPDQKSNAATLLKIVRESTERFQDVSAAEAEGYVLTFGCVT